ncbi:hypothetical protein BAE44_0010567 [Dichanthelium oligosanthes]|uniref:Uncharacterized protein n=1 Tax=Dichanthelium oligosanthes TaxID=888268 RepID=A0A1E5VTG9_9POAL|nr:hypothetical protein BAE44_0010567 [Dichanthelium oligosanthes]
MSAAGTHSLWLLDGVRRVEGLPAPPSGVPWCCGMPRAWLALSDHEESPTRLVLWELGPQFRNGGLAPASAFHPPGLPGGGPARLAALDGARELAQALGWAEDLLLAPGRRVMEPHDGRGQEQLGAGRLGGGALGARRQGDRSRRLLALLGAGRCPRIRRNYVHYLPHGQWSQLYWVVIFDLQSGVLQEYPCPQKHRDQGRFFFFEMEDILVPSSIQRIASS